MTRLRMLSLALALALCGLTFTACKKEGPAEKAGKEIDKKTKEAGDALKDMGKEIKEKSKEAKEGVKDAAKDATK